MVLVYILIALSGLFRTSPLEASKIDYWSQQRRGANCFNTAAQPTWFDGAREQGLAFVRLAADKWQGVERDFLIGDADRFEGIPASDKAALFSLLDYAETQGIKVVLTILSLPGSRWQQHNNDINDLRLWLSGEHRKRALHFWRSLAQGLKDHPALVGYNIINEPHPEVLQGTDDYRAFDFKKWNNTVKGSLADLNLFYKDIVEAIREVDTTTPIVLDTGLYATPWALEGLIPLEDTNIIYSFHMYEPFVYTNGRLNKGRFSYPGLIPLYLKDHDSPVPEHTLFWDKKALKDFFEPVVTWQQRHGIPSSRILVGEFGCDRSAQGAAQYLMDLIELFNSYNWHWAFYAFREDSYASMDYELGTEKPGAAYWEAAEKGENLNRFRKDSPLFLLLKTALHTR